MLNTIIKMLIAAVVYVIGIPLVIGIFILGFWLIGTAFLVSPLLGLAVAIIEISIGLYVIGLLLNYR